jgi:hypothetical protein
MFYTNKKKRIIIIIKKDRIINKNIFKIGYLKGKENIKNTLKHFIPA